MITLADAGGLRHMWIYRKAWLVDRYPSTQQTSHSTEVESIITTLFITASVISMIDAAPRWPAADGQADEEQRLSGCGGWAG